MLKNYSILFRFLTFLLFEFLKYYDLDLEFKHDKQQ